LQLEENTRQKSTVITIIRGTYFRDVSIAMATVSVDVKKCMDDWTVIQEDTKVWELEGNVEGFDSWYIIQRLRRNYHKL